MYKPTYLQHAFLTIYSRYTFRKDDLNICYQSLCQKKHQAPHPTTNHLLAFSLLEALWLKPKNNLLSNAFFSGPPCSRARNTDTFQMVVYEAQFFSQCVIRRFFFLTHKERFHADFMLCVIKWKLHGKVCFTLDKTHQEKGTIVT